MEEKKRIQSAKLTGLDGIHEDHRNRADMHSTGAMVFRGGDETNPKKWYIEYLCDVCHAKVLMMEIDHYDLIRGILIENGIIKKDKDGAQQSGGIPSI